MTFLQWLKQSLQTLVFATIIWGVEIAWLYFLARTAYVLVKNQMS